MKKSLALLSFLALGATLLAAEAPSREEINKSIAKGLAYLEKQQQPDGSFANPENKAPSQDHPALTAMPLMAFQRDPAGAKKTALLQKGYSFIRGKAQPDGGIYSSGLSNYNTSVCLMALLSSGDPKDEPLITKARAFVAGQQASNMLKPEANGGFGYGPTGTSPKRQHPDLDNTIIALEALHEYRLRRPATELAKDKDLDFKAAIDFISRCQNLPATNPLPGANGDAANKGGFVYYPGYSNAGEEKLPDGRTALRSYGSMSYAGLLSFIYADLDKSDQRVVAALDWLSKNYTLEENPAMGRQGIFYYYNLATRGLKAAGVNELTTAKGQKVDWRAEISRKIISLQNADGSWVNDQARWMEKDPVLVTTYCVMALENILAK
ncbi:MAG TPA: prenyltransferase/squalene oxidase repeat-containing protein [Chthoniobacteraceae bacterium]|jgi:squalene-hopene/tetraprenyl-beta-curcumene cyclase|nr:prenyltransferase/squalene oxidase repeat-containing protein [Chthoniobacteraceae bacterium]